MCSRSLIAFATLLSAHAAPLKCGVATKDFPSCPKCVESIAKAGTLGFWWNWDTIPKLDMAELSPDTVATVQKAFTPMLWGQAPPLNGYSFLRSGSDYVMGYNEPDQYGPACAGASTAGIFGCSGDPGQYRPATSDGWAPTFDPAKAAPLWQKSINDMTSSPQAKGSTVQKVTSPCMAQTASPEDNCAVDPSQPNAIKYCHGWMQGFKRSALSLPCTDFNGEKQNCWDIIGAIVIHGYARTAAEIKEKIKGYYQVFQEDFEGTNGRTKKVLWLTEVAMGSNDATEITKFVDDLMNSNDGLTNRVQFGFVERVSWFSEWDFPAFKVGNYTPAKYERWSSSLFQPITGQLSPVGEHFFAHCKGTDPRTGYRIV